MKSLYPVMTSGLSTHSPLSLAPVEEPLIDLAEPTPPPPQVSYNEAQEYGPRDKLAQFQSPILQNVENFLKRYFLHHHVRICSCASLSVNIY